MFASFQYVIMHGWTHTCMNSLKTECLWQLNANGGIKSPGDCIPAHAFMPCFIFTALHWMQCGLVARKPVFNTTSQCNVGRGLVERVFVPFKHSHFCIELPIPELHCVYSRFTGIRNPHCRCTPLLPVCTCTVHVCKLFQVWKSRYSDERIQRVLGVVPPNILRYYCY